MQGTCYNINCIETNHERSGRAEALLSMSGSGEASRLLLEVLAVHHPHLPTDLVLHLSQ